MQTLPDGQSLDFGHMLPEMKVPMSLRRSIAVGGLAVLAAVGGFGVWSMTVPLASAVVAPGKVTVAGKRKQIQHLDGGIVRSFAVKDGDHVNEGDVLIEFDRLRSGMRLAVLRTGYLGALAAVSRLVAERDQKSALEIPAELLAEATADPEVAAMLASQRQLFEARRNESAGQTKILESRVSRLKEEIRGFEAERSASGQQLSMAKEEQKTLEELYNRQNTTRTRVLAAKREVFQLEGTIGRLAAQIAAASKEIGETELNLAQIKKKVMTEVLNELRDVQSKVLDLREQYAASKSEVERTVLRSPSRGTVFGSQVHTVGGVLRGGETLLEIVPDHDQLIVEVRLRPQDVGEVQVGQPTEVRFSAFKQRTTPSLMGVVGVVSADTVTEPRTQETYYLASIEVSGDELKKLGDLKLQPGMPAEAMIKTGQRTAMAYLLQPLADSMNRAWRER